MNSDPALISIRVAEFCHYFLPATGPYIRLLVVDVKRHVGNGNHSMCVLNLIEIKVCFIGKMAHTKPVYKVYGILAMGHD